MSISYTWDECQALNNAFFWAFGCGWYVESEDE